MAGDPTDDSQHDPRKQRLADALRENLKRRKAQVRGRRENGTATQPSSNTSSAETHTDPASRTANR